MYSGIQIARRYVQHRLAASNRQGHGVHSPFVFDFICKVLRNGMGFQEQAGIEAVRNTLLRDKSLLQVEDLGAGSRRTHSPARQVSVIAATALKPPSLASLLARTAKHYDCRTVVELGTSLGVTTAYLSKGVGAEGRVHSIEGSAAIHQRAAAWLSTPEYANVHLHLGSFDTVLPALLPLLPRIDFGYIDGNHQLEPTLKYFHSFLPKLHEHSVLVFDDIHWSAGMEEAWQQIKQHPDVRCSIDLFHLGFVFFDPSFRHTQHWKL